MRPGDHPAKEMLVLGLADLYIRRGNVTAAEGLLQKAVAAYPANSNYADKLAALRHTLRSH